MIFSKRRYVVRTGETQALAPDWVAASLIVPQEDAAEGYDDDKQPAGWLSKFPTGDEQGLREHAKALMLEHQTIIERIARELMDHESLDGSEIDCCFEIEAGEATEEDLAVYRARGVLPCPIRDLVLPVKLCISPLCPSTRSARLTPRMGNQRFLPPGA